MQTGLKTIVFSIYALAVHSCAQSPQQGNLGYGGNKNNGTSQFRGGSGNATGNYQQQQFNQNQFNQNQFNQSQNNQNSTKEDETDVIENLDFTEVDPNSEDGSTRSLNVNSHYSGRGCSEHGAGRKDPSNTVSNGVLNVTESFHSYKLVGLSAVSGSQKDRFNESMAAARGKKDRFDRIHNGDVFNYFKNRPEQSYDALVYVDKIMNHRSSKNGKPATITFSSMIPTNVRTGSKCSDLPASASYATKISVSDTANDRAATMTVTKLDQGPGKCMITFSFDIPSDKGNNGGKLYERIPLGVTTKYHYDESEPSYFTLIQNNSIRAGTRDNKVYGVRMTMKLCKFEADGEIVKERDCGFVKPGCQLPR